MTTAERRLATLEASLSPTGWVKAWLIETHSHDTFDAFARADFARGIEDRPLDRLAREAQAAAETTARGLPRDERERAIRAAILETVFRLQLVLRTVVLAQEFLDREAEAQRAQAAQRVRATRECEHGYRIPPCPVDGCEHHSTRESSGADMPWYWLERG